MKTSFDPFFRNFLEMDAQAFEGKKNVPAVNISEDASSYQLEFAAPGFNKEDLKVKIKNDTLIVSAEKEESKEKEDKKFTRREYNFQSFSRSFYLPEQVKEDEIEATYENGILHLNLPKAIKEETHKEIAVK